MVERDFIRLLKRHDDKLRQTPLRLASDMRIRRAIETRVSPGAARWRTSRVIALAGLAAFSSAVFAWFLPRTWRPDTGNESQPLPAAVARSGCVVRGASTDHVVYEGRCDVRSDGVVVRTENDSVLRQDQQEWRVIHGRCRFLVEPLESGAEPLRVRVNGGLIEVVGTDFFVRQDAEGGSVFLTSGKIHFVVPGGSVRTMIPGEWFHWEASSGRERQAAPPNAVQPEAAFDNASGSELNDTTRRRDDAAPPAPSSEHETGSRAPLPAPAAEPDALPAAAEHPTAGPLPRHQESLDDAVEHIVRLRAAGRYAEALQALAALNQRALDQRTREVLSFERGTLLAAMGSRDAACHQFGTHKARYPNGRYHSLVQQKLFLDCNSDPAPPASTGSPAAAPTR